MLRALAVSLALSPALAACGGSPKQPVAAEAPPPSAAGASCQDVSAHLVDLLHPSDAAGGAALADRCDRDQWSAEARTCFANAKDEAAVSGCMDLLTAAQRDAPLVGGGDTGAEAPADASPPPPAPPHTRGPIQKGSGGADPCMGGEADPCMGGE